MLENHDQGVLLHLRVHPGAKKNEIAGEHAGALKVNTCTAPEKGKANKSVIEILAKTLKLRKSQFEILSGETSSQKKILVREITLEELQEKIRPHV